jgi:alpha-maltose-1-phosphate synthase
MDKPTAININLSTSGSRLGGAAIAAEFHSRYMAESFPVELWRMWDRDEEFYIDQLKVRNFSSKTKFNFLGDSLPKRVRAFLLDSDILDRVLTTHPSIVHIHNPLPSLAFEKIIRQASQANIKVVASTHGFFEVMYPNYNFQPHEQWLWKQGIAKPVFGALKYLDAITSLYPDEKKMLVELGVPEDKIHLTPNGVNPFFLALPTQTEMDAVVEKFGLSLDRPIVLFIGNHTANKGLPTVMQVSSQLSQSCTVVVGGKLLTPDEPQQWQQQFPANDRVKVVFTDYLTTAEQRALYHLSDVLLFPSLADTLPLTIIEAMASELPTISYDVGGIAYQLQDDCGILVKVGDFDRFLAAVEQLISDTNLRTSMAKNAKTRQERVFDWKKTAETTVDIYQQLLN